MSSQAKTKKDAKEEQLEEEIAEQKAVEALKQDGYSDVVIDHWLHPRNFGQLTHYDGYSDRITSSCGDSMSIWFKVRGGVIEEAKFVSDICIGAVSSGSMLTEMIKGKTVKEALLISSEDVLNELNGLPPQFVHCTELAVDTLQTAIRDYNEYKTDPWKRLYLQN